MTLQITDCREYEVPAETVAISGGDELGDIQYRADGFHCVMCMWTRFGNMTFPTYRDALSYMRRAAGDAR